MKKTILLTLLVLTILELSSNEYIFEKISTRHGLSQNSINCILQDSKGFLWFGTNDGLNKYDGYEFKTYRINLNRNTGLNSNLIRSLAEDKNGNIWIGTTDRGVNILDYKKDKIIKVFLDPERPDLLNNEGVFEIIPAENNKTWILCQNKLYQVKYTEGKCSLIKLNNQECIEFGVDNLRHAVALDSTKLLIGSSSRLLLLFRNIDGLYQIKDYEYGMGKNVTDIIPFREGFAIATKVSLFYLDQNDKIHAISNQPHTCLLNDSNKYLWAGTENGLFRYIFSDTDEVSFTISNLFTKENTDNNISTNYIYTICKDKSEVIWLGTGSAGLTKIHQYNKKFKHFKHNTNSSVLGDFKISSVYEDSDQNLWIGTAGGGLSVLPAGENDYQTGYLDLPMPYTVLVQNVFFEAALGMHPLMLSGTSFPLRHRVYTLNNGQIKFTELPGKLSEINFPICSYALDSNFLWIGTYDHGLFRYRVKTDSLSQFMPGKLNSLPSAIIRYLLNDSKNRLWIATDKGLSLLNPEEKEKIIPKFIHFKNDVEDNSSISYDYILPILETRSGEIWLGTLGGGLNKYIPKSNAFLRINTSHGLANDNIKGILEDDFQNLWISSNKGISRINQETLQISNFNISDGLQDNEFSDISCFKRKNGDLIFGGINGFNVFQPGNLEADTLLPDMAFTELQILNQTMYPGDKFNGRVVLEQNINQTKLLLLRYKENSFVVSFTALHFVAPDKIKYKYKLDGFDDNWLETSSQSRFAKYTNLLPGKYTLKVKATNSDGIWRNDPIILPIRVIRPWWASNKAIIIYILLMAVVFFFFRRYSIIKIQMKNALLMEHFEKEKTEELAKLKLDFFTNISHEFRTPLTLIIGYLDKIFTQEKKQEANINYFNPVKRNINILLRLIKQLSDFRKYEQGKMDLFVAETNIVEFSHQVTESFQNIATQKQINLTFQSDKKEIPLWFDQDKIEKVLFNLISNALKFTPDKGSIKLICKDLDSYVELKVEDTGIGIPEAKQKHIFELFYRANKLKNMGTGIGLSFSRSLIDLHQGKLSFVSTEGKGSCFSVTLPKGREHFKDEDLQAGENLVNLSNLSNESEWKSPLSERCPEVHNKQGRKRSALILIIEDNYEIREFIRTSLEDLYRIEEAENGSVGLKIAEDHNPDLILSDVVMPEMDGKELTKRLKNNLLTSHIPVILLTAYSSDAHKLEGLKTGADDYITKPFNIEILITKIDNLLKVRKVLKEKFSKDIYLSPKDMSLQSADENLLQKVIDTIEAHLSNPNLTVEFLSKEVNLSRAQLFRKLQALTNLSPAELIKTTRIKRAAILINQGKYRISEIMDITGFNSRSSFNKLFRRHFNMTPSEYQEENN